MTECRDKSYKIML